MSATWTAILAGMIQRDAASRATLDAALGRRLLTVDEHQGLVDALEARAADQDGDAVDGGDDDQDAAGGS